MMTLEQAHQHIRDRVVYHPPDDRDGMVEYASRDEDGEIVRVGQQFVFVRYADNQVKATHPRDLTLLGKS